MADLKQVEEVVQRVLMQEGFLQPKEELNKLSTFKDLDIDSLDQVSIVLNIEREMNIVIPDDQIAICNTVQELVTLVHEHTNLEKKYKTP